MQLVLLGNRSNHNNICNPRNLWTSSFSRCTHTLCRRVAPRLGEAIEKMEESSDSAITKSR